MTRSWRALLRIARRDAVRHKGRSILVVAMVALPVCGAVTADVAARTGQLDSAEVAARQLGNSDGLLTYTGSLLQQDAAGNFVSVADSLPRQVPLAELVPAGTHVVPATSVTVELRTAQGIGSFNGEEFAYDDPSVAGRVQQLTGRAPRTAAEVAVTTAALHHLGVSLGQPVTTPDGAHTWTVVGTVQLADAMHGEVVFGRPGSQLAGAKTKPDSWFVDVPGRISWPTLEALNAAGYGARPVQTPTGIAPAVPQLASGNGTANNVTALVVVVGLAILEVALLAGAAFAVGVRRQRRDLAMLAANGATAKHLRSVVRASGAVLGVTGALVGTALGLGGAAVLVAWQAHVANHLPGHFDVRPLEVLGALAFGVVAGIAAAVFPARSAARQDVVGALTGRRAGVRTKARVPVIGALMVAGGVALTAYAASQRLPTYLGILGGVVVTQLGFVVASPAIVAAVGRLAPLLPTVPRLALRDLGRQRARSAAAVAAVLVAVGGSVAVAIYASSQDARGRATYRQDMPLDAVSVSVADAAQAAHATAALHRALPDVPAATLSAIACTGSTCTDLVPTTDCNRDHPEGPASICNSRVWIVTPDAVTALLGTADGDARSTLANGGALVTDSHIAGGSTLQLDVVDDQQTRSGTTLTMPSVRRPETSILSGGVYVTQAVVTKAHLTAQPSLVYARPAREPTAAQLDVLRAALRDAGLSADSMYVERGYTSNMSSVLLVLLIASSVTTLGAVGIATGLAAADSHDDLVTLAAVGAAPRVRRLLTAAQGGAVAGVGSVVGIAAGIVPAEALLRANGNIPVSVPWLTMSVTAVGVPVLAALLCGAVVRSRLPVERRLG